MAAERWRGSDRVETWGLISRKSLATEWRQHLAMGVSPWDPMHLPIESPEGGDSKHPLAVAPPRSCLATPSGAGWSKTATKKDEAAVGSFVQSIQVCPQLNLIEPGTLFACFFYSSLTCFI